MDEPDDKDRRAPLALEVDFERHAHLLAESDLTEAQKREFLQTIWKIVLEFVAMGFEIHPVQQARNACGQTPKKASPPETAEPVGVNSSDKILSNQFSVVVETKSNAVEGRIKA